MQWEMAQLGNANGIYGVLVHQQMICCVSPKQKSVRRQLTNTFFSFYLPIYKDWMFFQVISALGAPRKVVDTVLESATHGGCNRLCAVSRIFQHRE